MLRLNYLGEKMRRRDAEERKGKLTYGREMVSNEGEGKKTGNLLIHQKLLANISEPKSHITYINNLLSE